LLQGADAVAQRGGALELEFLGGLAHLVSIWAMTWQAVLLFAGNFFRQQLRRPGTVT
jgi:hypothetical protein